MERAGIFLTHMHVCEETLQPNTHIPALAAIQRQKWWWGGRVSLYFQFFQHQVAPVAGGNVLFLHCVKDVKERALCWENSTFSTNIPRKFYFQEFIT